MYFATLTEVPILQRAYRCRHGKRSGTGAAFGGTRLESAQHACHPQRFGHQENRCLRVARRGNGHHQRTDLWTFLLATGYMLTDQQIPESKSIYLNIISIEKFLSGTRRPENCCVSCGEILGSPTMCRTLERNGQTFEATPASIIVEAAHRFVQAQHK